MAEKATLDEIAGTLIGGDATPDATTEEAPNLGADEADVLESIVDDTSEEEVDEQEEDQEVDLLGDDEEEDDTDPDQSGEPDEKPVLDIDEEDLIEVMIDGELEYRTIGEAMKALSGEGAIEKRLTEATEERKAASAERAEWQKQRETQTQSLVAAFNMLGNIVFEPRVAAPDERLRQTNANQYLLQKDAYNSEMQRIQGLQSQVQELFGQIKAEINDGERTFRKEQQKILAEKLPVLRDKKIGKQRQQAILDAAEHYGFTRQEISIASDHRLFLMAHDAALYRASQEKQKKEPVKTGKQKRKPPRTLRSGVVSKAKNRARNAQKRANAAATKAKKTGKVDDIAAMIMQDR